MSTALSTDVRRFVCPTCGSASTESGACDRHGVARLDLLDVDDRAELEALASVKLEADEVTSDLVAVVTHEASLSIVAVVLVGLFGGTVMLGGPMTILSTPLLMAALGVLYFLFGQRPRRGRALLRALRRVPPTPELEAARAAQIAAAEAVDNELLPFSEEAPPEGLPESSGDHARRRRNTREERRKPAVTGAYSTVK